MKKTKKFWAVLAAAGLLAASFAGCGSNASASAGSSSGSVVIIFRRRQLRIGFR